MSTLTLPTKILKTMETSSSTGMFVRDTGGCLLSKLAVSRSSDEAKEISFAEVSESALFYFSAPAAAKVFSNIFSKKYNINKSLITTPIEDIQNIGKSKLKDIKLAKFGQITSTFSVILPLVFAIAPLRNIMTYSKSGKDEFVSVIGLKEKENKKEKEKNNTEAKNRASKLIKNLALIAVASLGISSMVCSAAKNDRIYDKLDTFITRFIKNLDFTKNCDLKLSHYAALIYPVSIASYFYASRDKYEKEENARRFSVTVPLLFGGEKLIEKPIHKGFDKLFNTQLIQNGRIKSYEEIQKLPANIQKQYLKSKNWAYGLTFLTNTIIIAGAVGLLNRITTKKKFEREQKDKNTINSPNKVCSNKNQI